MKKTSFISLIILPAAFGALSNALASDSNHSIAGLAKCVRSIIDKNTTQKAVYSAAEFLDLGLNVLTRSAQLQEVVDSCNSWADGLKRETDLTRLDQMNELEQIPASERAKQVLREFISPTTICQSDGGEALISVGGGLGAGKNHNACQSSNGQNWTEGGVDFTVLDGGAIAANLYCRLEVRRGHRGNIPFISTSIGRVNGRQNYKADDSDGTNVRDYYAMIFGISQEQNKYEAPQAENAGVISGAMLGFAVATAEHHAGLSIRIPSLDSDDRLIKLLTTGEAFDESDIASQCSAFSKSVDASVRMANWLRTALTSKDEIIEENAKKTLGQPN